MVPFGYDATLRVAKHKFTLECPSRAYFLRGCARCVLYDLPAGARPRITRAPSAWSTPPRRVWVCRPVRQPSPPLLLGARTPPVTHHNLYKMMSPQLPVSHRHHLQASLPPFLSVRFPPAPQGSAGTRSACLARCSISTPTAGTPARTVRRLLSWMRDLARGGGGGGRPSPSRWGRGAPLSIAYPKVAGAKGEHQMKTSPDADFFTSS